MNDLDRLHNSPQNRRSYPGESPMVVGVRFADESQGGRDRFGNASKCIACGRVELNQDRIHEIAFCRVQRRRLETTLN